MGKAPEAGRPSAKGFTIQGVRVFPSLAGTVRAGERVSGLEAHWLILYLLYMWDGGVSREHGTSYAIRRRVRRSYG